MHLSSQLRAVILHISRIILPSMISASCDDSSGFCVSASRVAAKSLVLLLPLQCPRNRGTEPERVLQQFLATVLQTSSLVENCWSSASLSMDLFVPSSERVSVNMFHALVQLAELTEDSSAPFQSCLSASFGPCYHA